MPFSPAGLNIGMNAIAAAALSVRTHTGDPGVNGTANAGTGAAQACSWSAATNGDVTLASAVAFTGLGASEAVTYFSVWGDANTTFLGSGQITSGDVAANAAGEYTLNTGTTLALD